MIECVVDCSVLASLNLPAAIEDLSGGGGVPQSLLDKAAAMRQNGGVARLTQLINDLPVLLQRNKEILDEVWLVYCVTCRSTCNLLQNSLTFSVQSTCLSHVRPR